MTKGAKAKPSRAMGDGARKPAKAPAKGKKTAKEDAATFAAISEEREAAAKAWEELSPADRERIERAYRIAKHMGRAALGELQHKYSPLNRVGFEWKLRGITWDGGARPPMIPELGFDQSPEDFGASLLCRNGMAMATPEKARALAVWLDALAGLEDFPFSADGEDVVYWRYVQCLDVRRDIESDDWNMSNDVESEKWDDYASNANHGKPDMDLQNEQWRVYEIEAARYERELLRKLRPEAFQRRTPYEDFPRPADVCLAGEAAAVVAQAKAESASGRKPTRRELLNRLHHVVFPDGVDFAPAPATPAPAPAMADAGPHAIDPQAVAAGKAAQAGPAMAAATKCRGGRPKGKAKPITNAVFAEACGVAVRTVEGWNTTLREARERAKAQGKSDAQIAHVRIPVTRSGVRIWFYGLDQSASDEKRSPETFARTYNPRRFAER